MAAELAAGVLAARLTAIAAEVNARSAAALDEIGRLVHERAVSSISARSHRYRTPTPASRGGPPAMVSGTLAKSLTHTTPRPTGLGWEVKVGAMPGMFPPYSSRTPSSLYGHYLEAAGAGKNHIRYPFLEAAFHATAEPAALVAFKAVLAGLTL